MTGLLVDTNGLVKTLPGGFNRAAVLVTYGMGCTASEEVAASEPDALRLKALTFVRTALDSAQNKFQTQLVSLTTEEQRLRRQIQMDRVWEKMPPEMREFQHECSRPQ